jgi:hypothetical protein
VSVSRALGGARKLLRVAWPHRTRRHSTLGYLSPIDYENSTLREHGAGARRFAARIPYQENK